MTNDCTPGAASHGRRVTVGSNGGVPTILIDGQALPAIAYMTYLPGRGTYDEFADAGYELYGVACYLGDRGINMSSGIKPFRPGIWVAPDDYDFSAVEEDLARVIRARPNALVVLRVNLDVPEWWGSLHPGELSTTESGEKLRQSFSSVVWKEQAGRALLALIRHMTASPYANNLIAYHLAAGRTEEWMYHGLDSQLEDYSQSHHQAFRTWLREKYTTDATLRTAWSDRTVSLSAATVPSVSARTGHGEKLFRAPLADQRVIDFYQFHSIAAADAVIHFCRIVKEEVGDSALAGAFYGYITETPTADSGQIAMYHVLTSPYVEFLAGPSSYASRAPGNDWPYFSATDSVLLHGKIWMSEADTRTHLTQGLSVAAPEINPTGSTPGPYDTSLWHGPIEPRISMSLLKNNLARAITNGAGMWWFDMWGGWFADPEIMEFMKTARKLFAESEHGVHHSTADIAVIVDDTSIAYFGHNPMQNHQFVYAQRLELGSMGTPYKIFHLQDLLDERTHGYSLYIFLDAIKVDNDVRGVIHDLRKRGKSFIWGHGAGWFGHGDAPGIVGVADLTRIEMRTSEQSVPLQVTTLASGSSALAGIRPGTQFGTSSAVGTPLVHPTGANGEVLATVTETSIPGVVRIEHEHGGHSTYSIAPRIPPQFLRNAAKESGAHVYVDSDDVVYANSQFVVLHATSDGPRTIRLPENCLTITDVFAKDQAPIAQNTDNFTIDCKRYETYFLRLETEPALDIAPSIGG